MEVRAVSTLFDPFNSTEDSRWCVGNIHMQCCRSRDLYFCIIVFFCFSMLLYTLDQSVDLFVLKLFVNCLYRMNVV
jgi:hypothetical protein